jgi:hypothetical protein
MITTTLILHRMEQFCYRPDMICDASRHARRLPECLMYPTVVAEVKRNRSVLWLASPHASSSKRKAMGSQALPAAQKLAIRCEKEASTLLLVRLLGIT